MNGRLTVAIEQEGDGYVSLCLELDIASQGDTEAEAYDNLAEALALFFETAPAEEVARRPGVGAPGPLGLRFGLARSDFE